MSKVHYNFKNGIGVVVGRNSDNSYYILVYREKLIGSPYEPYNFYKDKYDLTEVLNAVKEVEGRASVEKDDDYIMNKGNVYKEIESIHDYIPYEEH